LAFDGAYDRQAIYDEFDIPSDLWPANTHLSAIPACSVLKISSSP